MVLVEVGGIRGLLLRGEHPLLGIWGVLLQSDNANNEGYGIDVLVW